MTPIVYVAYDGGIGDDAALCADTVPAVIGGNVDTVAAIAPKLQPRGIAVLGLNDVAVCTAHALDGVYYTDISAKDFNTVRKKHPHIQLGVFCGNSRHRAMVMGETGADFVVFNDALCVCWWATLMEVAVVQDIRTDNTPIAEGADFVLRQYKQNNP